MYGVYDEANGLLYKVYETEEEALTDANHRNSLPPVRRLTARPTPHYIAVLVVEDGLEEQLVGYRKHYSVVM